MIAQLVYTVQVNGETVIEAAKRLRPRCDYFPTISKLREETLRILGERRIERENKAIPEWVNDEKIRRETRGDPRIIDARKRINAMVAQIKKGMSR